MESAKKKEKEGNKAVDKILRKCLPDLAGLQLSGDRDDPIEVNHRRPPDPELARRLALALMRNAGPDDAEDEPADGLGQINGRNGTVAALPSPTDVVPGLLGPGLRRSTSRDPNVRIGSKSDQTNPPSKRLKSAV